MLQEPARRPGELAYCADQIPTQGDCVAPHDSTQLAPVRRGMPATRHAYMNAAPSIDSTSGAQRATTVAMDASFAVCGVDGDTADGGKFAQRQGTTQARCSRCGRS